MGASITARSLPRFALMRSDNNATISLAAMVGFDRVARWRAMPASRARAARPRWQSALTTRRRWRWRARTRCSPMAACTSIRGCWPACARRPATSFTDFTPTTKQVLDPRVAFLTTNMMEAVLQGNGSDGCMVGGRDYCGTGAGVRNMGFRRRPRARRAPSHDAWFAGFTTNLLCIVWVGNDDYTRSRSSKGRTRLRPSGRQFMKKAVQLPQYSDTHEFTPPEGVEIVNLDKDDQPAGRCGLPRRLHRGISQRHRADGYVRPSRRITAISCKRSSDRVKPAN